MFIFLGSIFQNGVLEIVFFVFIFACILFLAYITSKFVGKRGSARYRSKHIEIIDSINLGTDKQLLIVKVVDEYFLLAKSAKNIEMMTQLHIEADISSSDDPVHNFKTNFKNLLEKQIHLGKAKKENEKVPGSFRYNLNKIKDFSYQQDETDDSLIKDDNLIKVDSQENTEIVEKNFKAN